LLASTDPVSQTYGQQLRGAGRIVSSYAWWLIELILEFLPLNQSTYAATNPFKS
jgi:hypothetical protein